MTSADRPSTVVITEQLAHIADTVATIAERQQQDIDLTTKKTLDEVAARVATTNDTLAAIIATLEAMAKQQPGTDMSLLLADCRDTITEGIGALHSQGADVLHALQMLQAPPAKPVHPKQPHWLAGAVGLVGGGLLMGATWWVWPDGGYRSFLVGLDAVLVKHHPQLPAPVQDAVAAVYGRYQFQTPGNRQKGK